MGGDSGVGGRRDCAVEQDRGPGELSSAGEYRGDRAEKIGKEICS